MAICIGVIGCGSRLQYLLTLLHQQGDQVRVEALCDPNARAIAACRSAFNPQARVHDDHRALVADPAVDWVLVGSWNRFHREHAIAALKAGKHVFCEKPLATTLDDCLAMREALRASGRRFFIGFVLRYSPHYRRIKRLVADGAIGELVSLEFNETLDFDHGGMIHGNWRRLTGDAGSHMLEKCCHDVDLVHWLVGSPASRIASFGGLDFFTPANRRHITRIGQRSDGRRAYHAPANEDPFTCDKDIVDNQVAIIEFENRVRAAFHTNCNSAIPERRMHLCGTEGTIRADVISGRIEVQRIGYDTAIEDASTGSSGGHGGADDLMVGELLACMRDGTAPQTTLEDGLTAALTCFGIDAALASGQVFRMEPLHRRCQQLSAAG
jgi:predicted dehydrogenase